MTFASNAAILRFDDSPPSGPGFAINYTAATNSYTLTRGSATQAFAPGNISSISSANGLSDLASQFTFYDKSTASTQDLLFLTKAGGSNQTRYVSGGLWVHGGADDGAFYLFDYGFATVDAALPRSGSASFDIRAVGTAQIFNDLRVFLGEGNVTTDFATGSVELNGLMRSVDADRDALSGAFLLSGATTMSSTANGFSGTLQSGYYSGDLTGQFSGRFYGPAAEEIGGAFSLVDDRYFFGVGEFVGSRNTLAPYFTNDINGSVRNLASFRYFDTHARNLQMAGNMTDGTFHLGHVARLNVLMGHDPASGYQMSLDGPIFNYSTQPAPPQSGVEVWGGTGGSGDLLFIINPQDPAANVTLTYATFAGWVAPVNSSNINGIVSIIYGDLTAPSQMPRTGAAAYAGGVTGTAEKNGFGYNLTGTSNFNVNFANALVTGSASIAGTPVNGAPMFPPISVGLDFVDGQILSGTPTWSGSIKSGGQHVGTIDARFYGPAAAEMAGFWDASITQGTDTINMTGTVFGKKQ